MTRSFFGEAVPDFGLKVTLTVTLTRPRRLRTRLPRAFSLAWTRAVPAFFAFDEVLRSRLFPLPA